MMVIKGNCGEGKCQIGAVLSAIFGTNMKDGSIGKISEDRFARADLKHTLLCVDDDMRMEAVTGQAAQAEQTLEDAKAATAKQKKKLASAEKTISIWKQRYEAVNEKYMELKQKAQPFLDALENASERVRAFLNAVLARGKEYQEHKQPDRKRGQDMER